MEPIWFDIGQTIKDGDGNVIPQTVAAYSEVQYEEYCKKGWKPVTPHEAPSPPTPVEGVTSTVSGKKRKKG